MYREPQSRKHYAPTDKSQQTTSPAETRTPKSTKCPENPQAKNRVHEISKDPVADHHGIRQVEKKWTGGIHVHEQEMWLKGEATWSMSNKWEYRLRGASVKVAVVMRSIVVITGRGNASWG